MDPQRVELEIEPVLDVAGQEELIIRLEHQLGVFGAWFSAAQPGRLIVQLDPQHFSPTTLLDFVRGLGAGARLLRDQGADQAGDRVRDHE